MKIGHSQVLWTVVASAWFGGASSFCEPLVAVAQAAPTMDQILKVWKARQDHIRSAQFEWSETNFIAKGERTPFRPRCDQNAEVPPFAYY